MNLSAQELYEVVARRWLAGDIAHPRKIVGERPVTQKPRWVWDVLESTMGSYGFPREIERHLRQVAHTCHLEPLPELHKS